MACLSALASLQGFISMHKTGKGDDNSIVVPLLVCILIWEKRTNHGRTPGKSVHPTHRGETAMDGAPDVRSQFW
jgi:hypothetical protein